MVLNRVISTGLVSFTVPSTLSREKTFSVPFLPLAIFPVNNDAILPHLNFMLNHNISFLLIKSRALLMCNVTNCIGTHCTYTLSSIMSICTSSLNALISGILRLTSTYPTLEYLLYLLFQILIFYLVGVFSIPIV